MSEKILKALMQLFAIITRVDSGNIIGRNVVESFLKQQLSQDLVDEYLAVFDQFLENIHQLSKPDKAAKKVSLNSVKVLRICTEINQELAQPQKIIVLARLIEYIKSNGVVSEQELEFVETVASTFNISNEEYRDILSFITVAHDNIPDNPSLLIIRNQAPNSSLSVHQLYSETLPGTILVIHVDSVNMYMFRYFGHHDIQLNGQAVIPEKVYLLNPGSSLRSTKLQPIYYSDITACYMAANESSKIVFSVKELEFHFKSGKQGLHTLNMCEESGTLIGIMGGSGAGKSTVLNVLNGTERPSKGEVLINGINIHTEKNKAEGIIGFVPQDDLLIEELTVFQNLYYGAKLCFDNLTDAEIEKRVYDLLESLGLSETAHLKVGSPLEKTISGGQRKRLNIGLELIREPSVLFTDEPTSGLSSRDSENIMDLLKELTLKGKLVFVVIHQPSSDIFKMFDKLLILDLGGYPIYMGNPVDAVMYFKRLSNHANANESECITCGNVNPELVFNIIEAKVLDDYGNPTSKRKVAPREWNDYYHKEIPVKTPSSEVIEVPESTFKVPNKWEQFKVFITRDVLSKFTNRQYMIINFLETPVLAFILAFLVKYYNTDISNEIGYKYSENDNVPAYILMAVIIALFVGLSVSAEEIIRDRKILKRESFLNLSRGSYLFSKIAIMFAISAIQTFTFVLIGNSILEVKDMFTDYWFILFTTSCFANTLGLNISASFDKAVTIYILIPFLIIPQLILSGVIVKFDKLNPVVASQTKVPLAGEVMASRWAYEALAVNQFINNQYEQPMYKYDKIISIASYKKDLYIKRLEAKLDYCENYYQKNPDAEFIAALNLLRNEISKELNTKSRKYADFNGLDELAPGKFNDKVAAGIRNYLKELDRYYIKLQNQNDEKRDAIAASFQNSPEAKEAYIRLKYQYENESLTELVRNKNTVTRMLETPTELIQRIDPIYMDPDPNGVVRSHFFAPRKPFLGELYDTYWVNSIIIWLMTVSLIFTLYFDVLKKLLDASGSFFGKLFKPKR
jgi:ABC transport system ATP-binding/permease protein